MLVRSDVDRPICTPHVENIGKITSKPVLKSSTTKPIVSAVRNLTLDASPSLLLVVRLSFLGGHQQITVTGSGIIKRKSPDCEIFPFCKKKSNFIHMRFSLRFTFFVPDASSAPYYMYPAQIASGPLFRGNYCSAVISPPASSDSTSHFVERRNVIGTDRCAGSHCSFETAGATTCVHKSGIAKLPFVLIAKK